MVNEPISSIESAKRIEISFANCSSKFMYTKIYTTYVTVKKNIRFEAYFKLKINFNVVCTINLKLSASSCVYLYKVFDLSKLVMMNRFV